MNPDSSRLYNLFLTMKMSLLFRSSIIPLGIHLVLWWIFYLWMIIRKVFLAHDISDVSLAYWSWLWLAALLTVFINFIVSFRNEFGYRMLMSVPRHTFAGNYFQRAVVYNLMVCALILLDLNLLRFLNHTFGFLEIDFLSFVYGAEASSLIFQVLIVFSALMLFSMLGAFVGSSTYRFGLVFIWGFWLTVGLGTAMLLSLSEVLGFREDLIGSVSWFLGAGNPGSPMAGTRHFITISIVLMVLTWLNIRRIQLK